MWEGRRVALYRAVLLRKIKNLSLGRTVGDAKTGREKVKLLDSSFMQLTVERGHAKSRRATAAITPVPVWI